MRGCVGVYRTQMKRQNGAGFSPSLEQGSCILHPCLLGKYFWCERSILPTFSFGQTEAIRVWRIFRILCNHRSYTLSYIFISGRLMSLTFVAKPFVSCIFRIRGLSRPGLSMPGLSRSDLSSPDLLRPDLSRPTFSTWMEEGGEGVVGTCTSTVWKDVGAATPKPN